MLIVECLDWTWDVVVGTDSLLHVLSVVDVLALYLLVILFVAC